MFRSKKKKSYGLALGGGAARGFVHIGALRYLEEKNTQPSSVAGTSMGSMIGALVALGKTSEEIYDIFKNIGYLDILDFDLSTGVVKGDKILEKMKDIFGDVKIENLDIPLTIVATDLSSGDEVVFQSGPLLDAVRYSISIPVVFSLHNKDPEGELLVDGGLVNNLPVRYVEGDQIIAVSAMDLGGEFHMKKSYHILGIELGETKMSFYQRVLLRSTHIMLRRIEDLELEKCQNVLLIRPSMEGMKGSDLEILDMAVERGYNEAKRIFS